MRENLGLRFSKTKRSNGPNHMAQWRLDGVLIGLTYGTCKFEFQFNFSFSSLIFNFFCSVGSIFQFVQQENQKTSAGIEPRITKSIIDFFLFVPKMDRFLIPFV